jgi:hypothetical protein
MEDRQEGDYELLTAISKDDAETDLQQAQFFVEVVEAWLQKEGWK